MNLDFLFQQQQQHKIGDKGTTRWRKQIWSSVGERRRKTASQQWETEHSTLAFVPVHTHTHRLLQPETANNCPSWYYVSHLSSTIWREISFFFLPSTVLQHQTKLYNSSLFCHLAVDSNGVTFVLCCDGKHTHTRGAHTHTNPVKLEVCSSGCSSSLTLWKSPLITKFGGKQSGLCEFDYRFLSPYSRWKQLFGDTCWQLEESISRVLILSTHTHTHNWWWISVISVLSSQKYFLVIPVSS